MNGYRDSRRSNGSEYLTGQEVSYEEIMDIVSHRSRREIIGDGDIM